MGQQDIPEFFVDAVQNVSHANGVFRITLAQSETDEGLRPITKILIPANQLPRILQGLGNAAREIGDRVRERIAEEASEDLKSQSDSNKNRKSKAEN